MEYRYGRVDYTSVLLHSLLKFTFNLARSHPSSVGTHTRAKTTKIFPPQ